MSFRELTMIHVREVLRRWQSGQSARQIARSGIADRKTAGRYIEAALACGLAKDSELTDGVVAEVAQRVQARPVTSPSEQRRELEVCCLPRCSVTGRSRSAATVAGDVPT